MAIDIRITGFCKKYFLKNRGLALCFKYVLSLNSFLENFCLFLNKMIRSLKIEGVSCKKGISFHCLLLTGQIKVTFCLLFLPTLKFETTFGNRKLFKNDEKYFFFNLKSSFPAQDV